MSDERRQHSRVAFQVECSWSKDSRITDLSTGGCYVDCRQVPKVGAHAEFDAVLEDESTTLRGVVVHAHHGLGFAVAFTALDEVTVLRLQVFLAKMSRSDET